MGKNPVFGGHFEFLRPNRKQNFKIKAAGPYSRSNLIICRLNFENISISFRVMREQHTDRHTYIHTDRQTDGTKILYQIHMFNIYTQQKNKLCMPFCSFLKDKIAFIPNQTYVFLKFNQFAIYCWVIYSCAFCIKKVIAIRKTQPENQKSQNCALLRKTINPVSRHADRTAATRV